MFQLTPVEYRLSQLPRHRTTDHRLFQVNVLRALNDPGTPGDLDSYYYINGLGLTVDCVDDGIVITHISHRGPLANNNNVRSESASDLIVLYAVSKQNRTLLG